MSRSSWRLFPQEEGVVPYITLINLIIPFIFLMQEPPMKLGIGLAMLIVFIVSYREQFWRDASVAGWLLVLQLVIVILYTVLYYPVYAYIGFLLAVPLSKRSTRMILAFSLIFAAVTITVAIPLVEQLGPVVLFVLMPPLFGVCIMPFIIRSSARYKQMAERLKAATEQLERMAQEEERQRIARELHDTLGHTLSLISLKGEIVEKLITRDTDRAIQEVKGISETARTALKQMRELVTGMRVVRLKDEYAHARTLCATAGIGLNIRDAYYDSDALDVTSAPLSPLQETILAMCFREAVTNVVRHSRAAVCEVTLQIDEGSVELHIKDNGVGIKDEAIVYAKGRGIAGLKQRLMLIEGQLSIQSPQDKGTELTISIPRIIRGELAGDRR